jgi:multicomponent Na+:H+ antiporter subunit D
MKFFFMTIIAGVTLFWAITITYRATGSLDFGYGGLVSAGTPLLLTAFVCYLVGFGIKAALVPLHLWMPDAYAAAPVPAAALSSMLMLKTGVYGLIRVFYDLYGAAFIKGAGWHYIVLILAACSIIYGSLCAIAQDDLIRRLAYSGMAQVSYIILGLAMLSENALTGLLYHIMAHAFMKGCLFLCAGAIIMQTGKRKISELGGIGQQMPLVMIAFTVAGVSAVGIPPFNVFVSKWYLSLGALDIHQPLFIVLLLLSSIMNAAYYLPISMAAFFGFPGGTSPNITKKMGAAIIIPIVILAVGAFAFTLAPQNWPLNLAKIIAHSIFN